MQLAWIVYPSQGVTYKNKIDWFFVVGIHLYTELMHGIMSLRLGNSASKAVALFKKIWIIKYLFRWNRFVLSFCCDIFCGSRNSSAEAERVEQEMSYTNSNRTSDDLVWKIVESIRWDWNVSYVVLIRDMYGVIFTPFS